MHKSRAHSGGRTLQLCNGKLFASLLHINPAKGVFQDDCILISVLLLSKSCGYLYTKAYLV